MNQEEFAQALQKYADVVVRVGLNLREGQRLFIFAGIFDYPLVRSVAASAYNAGARLVAYGGVRAGSALGDIAGHRD